MRNENLLNLKFIVTKLASLVTCRLEPGKDSEEIVEIIGSEMV